ncbi:MAG: 16S rRNA processing protein RimM [Clostridia bacterium]|nr:16S rRNA processing protein RimM [Clostridia bacterium]
MREKYIEAGKIVGTHGVKGEMRVEVYTDSPEFLKKCKELYKEDKFGNKLPLGLISSRVHSGKNQLLILVKGITDPSLADTMRGTLLYFDRDSVRLPKNTYFISDILNCEVYDGESGTYYGKVEEVFETGANNVYRIVKDGKEYLFPAVESMIKSTDIDSKKIEVTPIKGIFDDEFIEDK